MVATRSGKRYGIGNPSYASPRSVGGSTNTSPNDLRNKRNRKGKSAAAVEVESIIAAAVEVASAELPGPSTREGSERTLQEEEEEAPAKRRRIEEPIDGLGSDQVASATTQPIQQSSPGAG